MSNQSFVQVPTNLTDEIELRRVLTSIVEQIDLISGNRAESPFVLDSEQVQDDTNIIALSDRLKDLTNTVKDLTKDVDDNTVGLSEVESAVDPLSFLTVHQSLTSLYTDFNDDAWFSLNGNGQIAGLGSDFTNPPVALTGTDNYIFYVNVVKTINGGIVQRVVTENVTAASINIHYRAGDTKAITISNGWLAV